jgi:sorting nexin-1/2
MNPDSDNINMPFKEHKAPTVNRQTTICDEDLSIMIEVVEPKVISSGMSGKHVMYIIRGKDDLSPFTCDRRYKEFIVLRKRLIDQWPGCYIPAIPPKQTLGNRQQIFIEKRRKLLNEFAKKAA